MSDEKIVTEREAIERERAAYERGGHDVHDDQFQCRINEADRGVYRREDSKGEAWRAILLPDKLTARARRVYPLPMVSRVVNDVDGWHYRVNDGTLQCRRSGGGWTECVLAPSKERVAIWADLYSRPQYDAG